MENDMPETHEINRGGIGDELAQPFEMRTIEYLSTGAKPWWIVSVLLHVLLITLATLLSMSIELPTEESVTVITGCFYPPPPYETPQRPKAINYDVLIPPTDPTSEIPGDTYVDPTIRLRAKTSDDFQTIDLNFVHNHSWISDASAHYISFEPHIDERDGGGFEKNAPFVIGISGDDGDFSDVGLDDFATDFIYAQHQRREMSRSFGRWSSWLDALRKHKRQRRGVIPAWGNAPGEKHKPETEG
jgi:hypothetical protein